MSTGGGGARAPSTQVRNSTGEDARVPKLDVDSELIEYMREWRRSVAHVQGVPAFVVMHDTTLEELCRKQPKSVQELMSVSGIGIKKSQTYGLKIIEALNKFRAG